MGSSESEKKCFVMICNNETEDICIKEKIMATVPGRKQYVNGITKGTQGLLWNYATKELIGIFEALEEPKDNSDNPDPWEGTGKGPYPIQFKYKIISDDLDRLPNASEIFSRAGIKTIPAHHYSEDKFIPESSVYEYKILEFFKMGFEAYIREVEKAKQTAVAAIMGRNMAHNLGSGVLSYLVNEYSIPIMEEESSAKHLYADIDSIEDKIPFRWFVRNNRFVLRYLQERMDFLATILTFVPSCSTMNLFKDIIGDPADKSSTARDVLNFDVDQANDLITPGPEYVTKHYLRPLNLIYNFLVFSETLDGLNIQREKLQIKFVSSLGESARTDISLPGGVIGKQAFYTILENLIRNAAKHSPDKAGRDMLEFTILISDFDQDKYRIDIVDNLKNGNVSQKLMDSCGERLINPVTGQHENRNLGIKEMKIASAFLQGISPQYVDDYTKDKTRQLIEFANDNGNLKCSFFMLKPKELLLLVKIIPQRDSLKNTALAKAGIDIMTPDDIRKHKPPNGFRHRFLVYFGKEISEDSFRDVQELLPIRQIPLDGHYNDFLEDPENFVNTMYKEWIEKILLTGKDLPALSIEMRNTKIPLVDKQLAIEFVNIDKNTPYVLFYDHFRADKAFEIKQKNPNYLFIEEITGGNSSKSRIRSSDSLELLKWELIEAGLTKVLIIDERSYNAAERDKNAEILKLKGITLWNYSELASDFVDLSHDAVTSIEKINGWCVLKSTGFSDDVKFTCMSIHQGIVDKINGHLHLEDKYKGKDEQKAKQNAMKEILDGFKPYADYIFVHSGRGKTEELPDGIRFINYPDLEHWLYDDKVTLVQGLFSVRGG